MSNLFAKLPTSHIGSNHRERMRVVMTAYAEKGSTLASLTDKRILGRSERTLKRYANDFAIKFSDWTPLRLRPKKPKPPKKGRRRQKNQPETDGQNEHSAKGSSQSE